MTAAAKRRRTRTEAVVEPLTWRKATPCSESCADGLYRVTWRIGGFSIWIVEAWRGDVMLAEHAGLEFDVQKFKARATVSDDAELRRAAA